MNGTCSARIGFEQSAYRLEHGVLPDNVMVEAGNGDGALQVFAHLQED